MLSFLLRLSLFLLPFYIASCRIHAKKISRLPNILIESSGLIAQGDSLFWSHNDGGGDATLYQFNKKGQLLKSIPVCDAKNVDWEEIYQDNAGTVYVGDFGNNGNARKDLTIYKIPNFKNKTTAQCFENERITFRYENQTDFPPPPADWHFDAEAMVATPDSIYIFTKDYYSKPYSGKTWVYRIPNKSGNHIAKCIAIVDTDKRKNKKGAITAAAYDAYSGKLALMSYQQLWILRGGLENAIFDIHPKKYRFGLLQYAQREAISFADSCTLFITSERIKNTIGGNLSKISICKKQENPTAISYTAPPPIMYSKIDTNKEIHLEISTVDGKPIFTKKYEPNEKISLSKDVITGGGVYFYTLFQNERELVEKGKIVIIR